ncbi:alpha/beta hydrolase [Gracilibacillus massiliensis]|uniref:alpha/beta hydrolase n=1 Tax=Gracilibacillus massiliensis TaxID=1564956 RepID=UPI00071C3F74|nr:alpha/beta hydrolase [Gracilibacillus massiliensis]
MKKSKRLKLIIVTIVTLLMIDIVAGNYFYNLAIKREQKTFLQDNNDLEVSATAMDVFTKGQWRSWVTEQDFEEWKLRTFDNLRLSGSYLPAKQSTNKTVIFTHGYLGKGTDMGLYAKYYYETLGYNVFFYDMRGHGKSEGDYFGFGWHDRLDVLDWTENIIDRVGEDAEIILHGLSMGAATMLMASGESHPDQVKAIVADSAYTDVYQLFQYQMSRMYHLPAVPILPTTSLIADLRANYSFREASALEQVKNAQVPILYFHGKADTFVPTEMANRLHENTSTVTDIMLFDDAGHGEGYALHPKKYQEQLQSFLDKVVEQ